MKTLLLIVSLFVVSVLPGVAQTSDSYQSTLKKVLEASGSEETFKLAIKQIIAMFKQQKTNIPDNVWADFEKEFQKTSMDDLAAMLTPVYQKHLTEADLIKVVEFYQTPAGKKYAEKTPFITQESMMVGQQWGMKLGQKITDQLKEKGY